jgi:hypothetical protein
MQKYRVPVKIGRFWLQKDYLVPLLDGLDEVEVSLQQDCVAAINAFLDESNPLGLLVCCRLTEYQWLPERLKLNGAICLEPLSQDDVDDYLDRAGPKLAALREAVNTDPVFQELTQTPLMLSIMSLTFKGAGSNELAAQKEDLPEKRRKQIFRLYVEKMFQRKGTASLMLPKEKTIGWLSWLAAKIKEHSQSVFLVEGLQPSWLGTKAKWVAYGIVVALSLGLILALGPALTLGVVHGLTGGLTGGLVHGLIYGLIFGLTALAGVGLGCWSESPLKNGLMSGSIAGLFAGLMCEMMGEELQTVVSTGLTLGLISGLIGGLGAGSLSHITLVETMSWKWSRFWKRTILGSIAGLIFGLIVGLIYGVFDALAFRQSGARMGDELIFIPFLGLFFGLIVAPIFGLISGLVGGLTDKVKVGKASPNQGVKLSLKNSLVVFLTIALIFALIFGLVGWLTHRELYFGLTVGPIVGLVVGLTGALNRGGSAVIKHYALRLILWMSRYTPLNFIKFLDHCAKLILLKKVGGGYIFIHRMLLDYFAELTPESVGAGDTTKRLK